MANENMNNEGMTNLEEGHKNMTQDQVQGAQSTTNAGQNQMNNNESRMLLEQEQLRSQPRVSNHMANESNKNNRDDVSKQLEMEDRLLNDRDFAEETATEIAVPVQRTREPIYNQEKNTVTENGQGLGWIGIALSILSLFVLPVLFGAAGIIVGFIARRRGAQTLGSWAIGIGAVSIIVGLFILPFF